MKVNTDGVLLAAWMNVAASDSYVLEIGTGCGVMAIMAAQRICGLKKAPLPYQAETRVDAVEIDTFAAMDAEYNFRRVEGKFGEGIKLNIINLQANDYAAVCGTKYDLIFSNPPFFSNSLKNRDPYKTLARHNGTLTQSDIIRISLMLLVQGGRLALILPVEEAERFKKKIEFLQRVAKEGDSFLALSRECHIKTTPNKEPKRLLLEFVYLPCGSALPVAERDILTIHNENGGYSDKYKSLTGDFYLNF